MCKCVLALSKIRNSVKPCNNIRIHITHFNFLVPDKTKNIGSWLQYLKIKHFEYKFKKGERLHIPLLNIASPIRIYANAERLILIYFLCLNKHIWALTANITYPGNIQLRTCWPNIVYSRPRMIEIYKLPRLRRIVIRKCFRLNEKDILYL